MSVSVHILDTAEAEDVAGDMVLDMADGMWEGMVGGMEDGMGQGIMEEDIIMEVMDFTHITPCTHTIMEDFTHINITLDTM
jgi:hypothetical protein